VARSIYIASPNAGTGKSTVALGLVSCLTKVVAKVGVFRPFVESREGDAFLSLLLNRAGSTTPPEQCVGATWDEFHADPEEALARIVDAYRALAREHDVVIIDGSDFTDVAGNPELALNARVAANIGVPVLLVVSGQHDVEDVVASVEVSMAEIADNHARTVAVVANKCLPETRQAVGEALTAEAIEPAGHETLPPPRYTEASLVKTLDELGIGRPSTYAAVISTIMDRGYVNVRSGSLIPSWIAFSVVRLLESSFGPYVNYEFTAQMEEDLDRIARGEESRVEWLGEFYFGGGSKRGLKPIVDNLGEIDARSINSIPIADGIVLRVGKFGPYLEAEGTLDTETGELTEPIRANVPADLAPDELTEAKARELLEQGKSDGRVLGVDPVSGNQIVARDGRYGPYVTEVIEEMTEEQIQAYLDAQPTEYYKNGKPKPKKKPKPAKPRTASLFKSMDLATVTLEQALQLMSLPRVLGTDAEGVEITVQNGRFGPYLKKGTDSRSIGSEDEIFTITLEQALEIYSQPKQRGRAAAKPPLAELGVDPVSEKKIVVKDGRFGPYITDGITNITVPRAESVESLTHERAVQLLADKRAKGPVKRKTAAKKTTTAKKTTAKKTTAKSTTAKKTTTRKTAAKKTAE